MVTEARLNWNTPSGGAGVTVLHTTDVSTEAAAQAVTTSLRAFAVSVRDLLPAAVTLVPEAEVRVLNTLNGSLSAVFATTPGAPVTGNASGIYASASGIRLDLQTSVIASGRRLRGRIYFVPAFGSAFANNGNVTAAAASIATTAWGTWRDALQGAGLAPVVYSRTHGIAAAVTGTSVPPRGAVLRSRRD